MKILDIMSILILFRCNICIYVFACTWGLKLMDEALPPAEEGALLLLFSKNDGFRRSLESAFLSPGPQLLNTFLR